MVRAFELYTTLLLTMCYCKTYGKSTRFVADFKNSFGTILECFKNFGSCECWCEQIQNKYLQNWKVETHIVFGNWICFIKKTPKNNIRSKFGNNY